MKKHILTFALAGAFAAGLVTVAFAQTNPAGGSGAGSVGGAKSDTGGANPASDGTTAGPGGASTGTGTSMGKGSPGISKASKNTSEDRVPHN